MTTFKDITADFPTDIATILKRLDTIDPINYGRSRNYIDGSVSYLSPYISRGVLSTKIVFEFLQEKGYHLGAIEKFIQELAWRDYWQQIWIAKGDAINQDLRHTQHPVHNTGIATAIDDAETGIIAIDKAIATLYDSGYMHNHARMYVSSIACNMYKSHWKTPAQWMYYHLLDADWASNALSWQWVAGANSNKKYYANQDNINKYCHTEQKNTFLDVSYDSFETIEIPQELSAIRTPDFKTVLPNKTAISIVAENPTYIYNFYNLDPKWDSDEQVNRILLLEPSHFEAYPISEKSVDFMMGLSENIADIQIYVGEFDDLVKAYELTEVKYKEHPLNKHYQGEEVPRDWMFNVTGYFSSFFGFWKKCKKELKYLKK